jgi:hypothetical protein
VEAHRDRRVDRDRLGGGDEQPARAERRGGRRDLLAEDVDRHVDAQREARIAAAQPRRGAEARRAHSRPSQSSTSRCSSARAAGSASMCGPSARVVREIARRLAGLDQRDERGAQRSDVATDDLGRGERAQLDPPRFEVDPVKSASVACSPRILRSLRRRRRPSDSDSAFTRLPCPVTCSGSSTS